MDESSSTATTICEHLSNKPTCLHKHAYQKKRNLIIRVITHVLQRKNTQVIIASLLGKGKTQIN